MSSASTVSFDVGGTVFKVSRSLLERHPDTMLARMASETWRAKDDNNTQNEAIFIERDPAFFRYVLSYMRDGQAFLPASRVSKDAILQELQYFGFQNVNSADLQVACLAHESLDHLEAINDKFEKMLTEHRRHKTTFDQYEAPLEVSFEIFKEYRTNCDLTVSVDDIEHRRVIRKHGTRLLNEFLQMFGVRCIRCAAQFTLERLNKPHSLPLAYLPGVIHPMAESKAD